jgi:hypothetical protein
MSDGEIEEKFFSLADPVLTHARSQALAAQLWKLEELNDVGVLFDLTRVG